MSYIKELYYQQIERQAQAAPGLPAQLWPHDDPVMVIPVTHYSGEYPKNKHTAVCKSHFRFSAENHTIKGFKRVTYKQHRDYKCQYTGRIIAACPHCQHEHVYDLCLHLEKASGQYGETNQQKYTIFDNETEANRAKDAIRQQNSRKDIYISKAPFPLNDGRVVLVHDAPHIEGTTLPSDRTELFNLLTEWTTQTPDGKRAGRGIKSWGKPAGSNKPQKDTQNDDVQRWQIIGKGYGRVAAMLSAYLDDTINPKGIRLDLDASKVLDILGKIPDLEFALIGDIPEDVTLKTYNQNTTCVKCDIPEVGRENTAVFSQSGLGIGQESGKNQASPKPIYLNGEYI